MSKLIVMPGDRAAASPAIKPENMSLDQAELLGHVLMLNVEAASHFACGGFQVSRKTPTATVSPLTQLGPIRLALQQKKLIDVTGMDLQKGIKTKEGEASGLKITDTKHKVYIGQDSKGNTYVTAAKTQKEQKKLEGLIKKTGTIPGEYVMSTDAVSGFKGIQVSDIEPPKSKRGKKSLILCSADGTKVGEHVIKSRRKSTPKKKAVKNASTNRRKRKSAGKCD